MKLSCNQQNLNGTKMTFSHLLIDKVCKHLLKIESNMQIQIISK